MKTSRAKHEARESRQDFRALSVGRVRFPPAGEGWDAQFRRHESAKKRRRDDHVFWIATINPYLATSIRESISDKLQ